MDTKALRQKVLDLAIRGKLVPQDPNDEPASVLLERIRQQKQQMVKEGKLKAKDIKNDTIIFVGEDNLHYEKFADGSVKCIEDEIPFDLPNGWAWSKINTIAFVTKLAGFEYTKNIAPNLCEDGIPLFKGKNVQNSTIIYEFESFIPESVSDELQRSQIVKKCILTPYVGTIGNIGIHNRPGKYHLGSNVGKIELYNDAVTLLEEYVVSYLQSGFGYQQLTKHMKATAQASISIEAIRDVYIPIPPVNEQLRMWDALSVALAMIEHIEKAELDITDLINATKSKILDLAIRGQLVPQDPSDEPASVLLERIRAEKEELIRQGKIKRDKKESIIFRGEDNSYYFDIPDGWALCSLKELFNVCSAKRVRQSDWRTEGVPFYRAREIVKLSDNGFVDNELFISEEHYMRVRAECGVPEPGDLMVSGVGTIGKVYVVNFDDRFYYKDASVLCFENRAGVIDSQFARYMLESEFLQAQMKDNSKGTTVDTITISAAMEYVCVLPPLAEQKRIVLAIETAFAHLRSISEALT